MENQNLPVAESSTSDQCIMDQNNGHNNVASNPHPNGLMQYGQQHNGLMDHQNGFGVINITQNRVGALDNLNVMNIINPIPVNGNYNSVTNNSHGNNSHGMYRNWCGASNYYNGEQQPSTSTALNHQGHYCTRATSTSNDLNAENKKKRKRSRTAFTCHQITILEGEYKKNHFCDRTRRLQIAQIANLLEDTIKVWFQNRRMKDKKNHINSVNNGSGPQFASNCFQPEIHNIPIVPTINNQRQNEQELVGPHQNINVASLQQFEWMGPQNDQPHMQYVYNQPEIEQRQNFPDVNYNSPYQQAEMIQTQSNRNSLENLGAYSEQIDNSWLSIDECIKSELNSNCRSPSPQI